MDAAHLADLRAKLINSPAPFVEALRHGTMSVELFAPRGADTQMPHDQDELYFVNRGSAQFDRDGNLREVVAGDVLFVPAGMKHRFVEFSEDFETWVVFWGPKGGE